jgi:hypothetical protein
MFIRQETLTKINGHGSEYLPNERLAEPSTALPRMQTWSLGKSGSGIYAAAKRPSWEEGISSGS